jgi:hypothetical protein
MNAAEEINGQALAGMSSEALNAWFDKRLAESMAAADENKTPRLSIMVTKGTLDWAYPPFILGATGTPRCFLPSTVWHC